MNLMGNKTIWRSHPRRRHELHHDAGRGGVGPRRPARREHRSAIVAELATEGIRGLHKAFPGHHLYHLPIILIIPHVFGGLTLDNDDGPYELVVFRTPVDLADERIERTLGLVGLDDIRWVETAGVLYRLGPQRELHI